ncbi:hypothetical protein LIER_03160 [Lithospermum erythrorhizon]|uniref:Uncharacterized protein n=1 Tax=Lithospermum erythrorhizon TaxID=34254 RepID=A0AAV3NTC1_LITER
MDTEPPGRKLETVPEVSKASRKSGIAEDPMSETQREVFRNISIDMNGVIMHMELMVSRLWEYQWTQEGIY